MLIYQLLITVARCFCVLAQQSSGPFLYQSVLVSYASSNWRERHGDENLLAVYTFPLSKIVRFIFPNRVVDEQGMNEWQTMSMKLLLHCVDYGHLVDTLAQRPYDICMYSAGKLSSSGLCVSDWTFYRAKSVRYSVIFGTDVSSTFQRLTNSLDSGHSLLELIDNAFDPDMFVNVTVALRPNKNAPLYPPLNCTSKAVVLVSILTERCHVNYGNTSVCRLIKSCSAPCGMLCNFESSCSWHFEPSSGDNGFRIVSGTDKSGQSGHYAYFGTSRNEEVVAKIVSPFYQHTATHCKLKFQYRLHGMPRTELVVVLESLPDQANVTRSPMQLKTFPSKTGLVSEWTEEVVSIGQFPWPMRIRLEAWLNNNRPMVHVNYSADCMVDNISLTDCEEEIYHADVCMSNRTEKYRCQSNKVCIERDQLCDMSVDCYGGEDEDSAVHNCTEVPYGARCNFENDTCGWQSMSDSEFRWIRVNVSHRHANVDKEGDRPFTIPDHTLRNASGHFMYIEPGNSEKMLRAFFVSPQFPPMNRSVNDPSSNDYRQCRIRFFFHHFGRDWHSVFLFIASSQGSFRQKIWEEDKSLPPTAEHYDYYWQRVSVVLPYMETDYVLQFVAVRMAIFHGNFGLDDVSLTPQCFAHSSNYRFGLYTPALYNFTTCQAVGPIGPDQSACDQAYNDSVVEVRMSDSRNKQGVQLWKAPVSGEYLIVSAGASGGRMFKLGPANGGARVETVFNLTKRDHLWIGVGQKGQNPCHDLSRHRSAKMSTLCSQGYFDKRADSIDLSELPAAGGGGATFVAKVNYSAQQVLQLLLVAAGGGGQFYANFQANDSYGGRGLSTGQSHLAPKSGESVFIGQKLIAGGGAGVEYLFSSLHSTASADGRSFASSPRGGYCKLSSDNGWKAFGGFGGGGASCGPGGGGGGGFLGGDAGNLSYGQGGWSFSANKQSFFLANHNPSNGFVLIYPCSKICPDEQSICRFVNRSPVCVCPNGQLLNSSQFSCAELAVHSTGSSFHTVGRQEILFIVLILAFVLVTIGFGVAVFIVLRRHCFSHWLGKKGLTAVINGAGVPLDQLFSRNFHSEFNPNYEFFGGSDYGFKDLKEIPRCCVLLTRALGQGAFGEVFEGTLVGISSEIDGLPVAVKTLPEYATEQAQMDFHMEALIMSKFRHPNIVQFHGVCFEKMPRLIVLELLSGGDLKTFLRESRPSEDKSSDLDIHDLLQIALDVARGCKYLEENHFIHRDIAARNCLLTTKCKSRVVKIADFGMARDIYRADYYRKGGKAMLPVKWMPPEAFLDGIFTSKTDVWSYGVLLWEIFSMGYMPYPGRGNQEVMQLVTAGGRLECPLGCPVKIYQTMTQCWNTMTESRPNFQGIIDRLEVCLHDPSILATPLPSSLKPSLHLDFEGAENQLLVSNCRLNSESQMPSEDFMKNVTGINADMQPPYQRQTSVGSPVAGAEQQLGSGEGCESGAEQPLI